MNWTNKNTAVLGSLVCAFIFAAVAMADDKPTTKAPAKSNAEEEIQVVEGITCTHDKDVRRIEAQTKDAGCVLLYTKFGKTSQIGASRRGVELCREKLQKVRGPLEKAGYKCE